jgi:hypothetical protein
MANVALTASNTIIYKVNRMEQDAEKRHEMAMELARLRSEVERMTERMSDLESGLGVQHTQVDWRDREYYLTYYATTGFFLGMVGAITSLLFNVIGAVAVGLPPLKIIQIYLTFGLGEQAKSPDFDNSLALLVGCCLYVATGMVFGIPFQILMSLVAHKTDILTRLLWGTAIGLSMWIGNYYCVLIWLQPLLFGDAWIVKEVPWYVGAGTHLVFAWTMACLYPYGVFSPYRTRTE